MNLFGLKSTSLHFNANNSLLRKPVVTANRTRVRSLKRKFASNP
jgi:hypothetical protein